MSDDYEGMMICYYKDENGHTDTGIIHHYHFFSKPNVIALGSLVKTINEIKESIALIERFLGDDFKSLKEEEAKLVEKDE